MDSLVRWGRTLFGIALIAIGIQQFFYSGFRPFFTPDPEWLPLRPVWVALFNVLLISAGALIILGKKARSVSLILGGTLLLLLLIGHVPYQLNRYPQHLGSWTNALKGLAFSGGAFVVAGSFSLPGEGLQTKHTVISFMEKLVPAGRIFFSITMILFGIDHFIYTDYVANLVSSWIPGKFFWTYTAAVALIASGLAIILKTNVSLAAFLLGIILFTWTFILHLPRAIANPALDNGNEITSVFQALGFSGIAFVLAGLSKTSLVFGKGTTKIIRRSPERENKRVIENERTIS